MTKWDKRFGIMDKLILARWNVRGLDKFSVFTMNFRIEKCRLPF